MLLTLRTTNTHGNARSTADAVISALTPAAWYRNATGVTSAGGFASQWDDYSGNARHLVQLTGTNQPAYAAGVFTFDGADNFLKTSAFTLNQPETIYLVGTEIAWTNNDDLCDGGTSGSALIRQYASSPNLVLYAGSSLTAYNSDLAIGQLGIICAVFNGAGSSLRINNNTKTTGNPGSANMGGFILGASYGGASSFCSVSFKEAIIFAAAHDDATQSAVISALNNALTVF